MKCKNVTSRREPQSIETEKLTNGFYNIKIAENVSSETVTRKNHSGEDEKIKQYRYDLYSAAIKAVDYGSFIAGVMHLKYNADDEIALTNKGIADAENEEYKAYRAYAQAAKAEAARYFDNE